MTQPAASGPDQFDPAAFTVVEPKAFEDLKVGDIFRAPSRTLTDAHATAFQAVSANNHPGHDRQPAWPAGLDGEHTYLLKTAQQSPPQDAS